MVVVMMRPVLVRLVFLLRFVTVAPLLVLALEVSLGVVLQRELLRPRGGHGRRLLRRLLLPLLHHDDERRRRGRRRGRLDQVPLRPRVNVLRRGGRQDGQEGLRRRGRRRPEQIPLGRRLRFP